MYYLQGIELGTLAVYFVGTNFRSFGRNLRIVLKCEFLASLFPKTFLEYWVPTVVIGSVRVTKYLHRKLITNGNQNYQTNGYFGMFFQSDLVSDFVWLPFAKLFCLRCLKKFALYSNNF